MSRSESEPYDCEKRFLLTRPVDFKVQKLVVRLAWAMGTTLKFTHLVRALLIVLIDLEPYLTPRLEALKRRRPPNQCREAIPGFEHSLATAILEAVRAMLIARSGPRLNRQSASGADATAGGLRRNHFESARRRRRSKLAKTLARRSRKRRRKGPPNRDGPGEGAGPTPS